MPFAEVAEYSLYDLVAVAKGTPRCIIRSKSSILSYDYFYYYRDGFPRKCFALQLATKDKDPIDVHTRRGVKHKLYELTDDEYDVIVFLINHPMQTNTVKALTGRDPRELDANVLKEALKLADYIVKLEPKRRRRLYRELKKYSPEERLDIARAILAFV